ncbi:ATP-binding protein [Actinophytocola gossypii]|uniref:AAA family ATPase n=1 Tax=Actinophytocola gossypii TaxID=2812003 RepID=A0ABT2JJY3_9PSEU|nr:AAA family ATPase [Actinophytocola gossypii]MCT2588076.1 AAA family ATPase [Actinophytocola gossypii]
MAVAELIGRDHPAALLHAEIGRVADSHGGMVLVTGEAGIGKTTLVTAAMEAARRAGALVLSGSCWDSAAAPGYWPWVQVVRALRRHATGNEWAAAESAAGSPLAFLLGDAPTTEPAATFQLYDAVASALVAVAQERPVVVVLDDLHWADPESVRLLEFVAQHTWFERVLLVGTYRDVEVEAGGHPLAPLLLPLLARATTITLTGLDEADVGALLSRTTGTEPDRATVAEVHLRTGGNPFFVEQTARLWHRGGTPTAVAPGVRDAVRRRLSLLAPVVSDLLTGASVLGREFHRRVLTAIVGAPTPQVARLLDEAVTARLVVPLGDGLFAFAHDLVRETLYESLDEDERKQRHAAVVRALESSTALAERIFPADLARHAYLAADELAPARVLDHLLAAAKDARRRVAFEEATSHYRRALEFCGRDDPRRARVCLDLGSLLYHFGPSEDAAVVFREAADVALAIDDPEVLARVALTLYGVGDQVAGAKAKADLLRAAHGRLVRGGEVDRSGGRSLDHLAQEVILQLIATARSDNDDEQLGFSLWTMHDQLWGLGNAAERQALTDELVTVARRTGDREMEQWANSLGWVAALEQGQPRYDDRFREFVRLAEVVPAPTMAMAASVDQAIIAGMRGRFAEAEAFLAKGFEDGDEHEHPHFGHIGHHLRWALAALRGDFDTLDELRRAVGESTYPFPELLDGITAALRDDAEEAARCLAVADARTKPVGGSFLPLLFRLRAHVAALTRDPATCERARADLAPYADHWLVSLYGCDVAGPVRLWVATVDAAQARWPAAADGFTSALRSAELLGARPWVIEAKLGLATALRGRGSLADRATAATLVEEATREAAAIGVRHRAGTAAPAPASPPAETTEFRRDGAVWTLAMAGRTVLMPDAKGLRDLHVLLSSPGTEVPATRLLNPEGGEEVVAASRLGGDDVLDATAKAAYRKRLSQLDDEIDAAALSGDDTRAAALDEEREALLTELRSAAGLGGRTRRLGDEAERARKAVTGRIRDTLRKLDDRHPELAAHLREAVSTGATCRYAPAEPAVWRL